MLTKDSGDTFTQSSQSYYFQFIANKLRLTGSRIPNNSCTFTFVLSKGIQKIDEIQKPIKAHFKDQELLFQDNQLNFCIPNYNPHRNIQFAIKVLINDGLKDQTIGSISVGSGKMIKKYKQANEQILDAQQNISDNYSLKYFIYIDKTRFGLQKLKNQSPEKSEKPVDHNGQVNEGAQKSSHKRFVRTSLGFQTPKSSKSRQKSLQRKFIARSPSRDFSQTSSQKRNSIKSYVSKNSQIKQSSNLNASNNVQIIQKKQQQQQILSLLSPEMQKGAKQIMKSLVTNIEKKPKKSNQKQLRSSRSLAQYEKLVEKQKKLSQKSTDFKYIIKITIFIIVSFYLIYNAMTPARKVSKRY